MIIIENINENLIKHYSDKNVYIRQIETGIEYSSAVDVTPCKYTYEETDKEIAKVEYRKNLAEANQ